MEGVVLITDDLLAAGVWADAVVLPLAVLPDDTPADASARLADVLLLFLLTVLLLPIPPLRDELLPNTLSELVWCLEPYHTSL